MRVKLEVYWGQDDEGRDVGLETPAEIPEGASAAEAEMVFRNMKDAIMDALKRRGLVEKEPGEPGTPECVEAMRQDGGFTEEEIEAFGRDYWATGLPA